MEDGARQLLLMCAEDYVHLGYVWQFASEIGGADDPGARLRIGLAYVGELLASGLVTAGEMQSGVDGLVQWQGSVEAVLKRIERLATELGREPGLGDNAYLVATERGDRVAEQLWSGAGITEEEVRD